MSAHELPPTAEGTEVLQFNLTNPDQLTEQLEAADLNDEETDLLLNEALKLNAQLKQVLRDQQLEEKQPSGKMHGKKVHSHDHPLAAPLAPRNPRKSCLPPIGSSNDKVVSGTKHRDLASRSPPERHVNSDMKRKGSAKKSRRPTWDDRFSYS